MGYTNIFVSSPCSLSIKNKQLVVRGEEERHFALEDIDSVMLESCECQVSSYALQALANANAAVFVCDRAHMPCGILLPYKGHFKQPAILRAQLEAPRPLQKRMWQSIVKRKIENQAKCCEICLGESGDLRELVSHVMSGDSGNAEAVAAALHFRILFGDAFARSDEANAVNGMLNYAYAILRGLIARTLAVYGLEACLGVHHRNLLNAFNLADDLIEPFRPIADMAVWRLVAGGKTDLDTETKRALFSLMTVDAEVNGQAHALSYAVELVVQSLVKSLKTHENLLTLPVLVLLAKHEYE